MTPVQHDELVHILERRLEGPEYQTFCGLVVNLFAPAMLACWPRTMDRQRERLHGRCVSRYLQQRAQEGTGG